MCTYKTPDPFKNDEIWLTQTQPMNDSHLNIVWDVNFFMNAYQPIYLHAIPSSWGAAYFGWHWIKFLNFYYIRTNKPYFDKSLGISDPVLNIPYLRSGHWGSHSWKRFLIDYMYGRGQVMIYANIPRLRKIGLGYSANHMAVGTHRATSSNFLFTSRVISYKEHNEVLSRMTELKLNDLLVFDMHLIYRPSIGDLKLIGEDYLNKINSTNNAKYNGLIRLWNV